MCDASPPAELNWAGNYRYAAGEIVAPRSEQELSEVVRSNDRVRALGTRHCFNAIADPGEGGVLISMANMRRVWPVDDQERTVTVGGGANYGDLCESLSNQGWALHNLASLPHISVAGACATATHGSGEGNGCLATAATSLEVVGADGAVATYSRKHNPDTFPGMVVSLGAVGIVSKITLEVIPNYAVAQHVYTNLPLEAALTHFDDIQRQAYSVSLFTDWRSDCINQVWLKSIIGRDPPAPTTLFGAHPSDRKLHPVEAIDAKHCTDQLGNPGPWHRRMPHFKLEFTPSVGEELQSEYLVPRHNAADALKSVYSMRAEISPLLMISEIRTIAGDDLWMSPCCNQPCIGIHFTWHPRQGDVEQLLPRIEACLAPFNARPHWGKLHMMRGNNLASQYSRVQDFLKLAEELDPAGKFWSEYLSRLFGVRDRQ